jgi:hypothetical protein
MSQWHRIENAPGTQFAKLPAATHNNLLSGARILAGMFRENFKKFEAHVGTDVLQAAPNFMEAAR